MEGIKENQMNTNKPPCYSYHCYKYFKKEDTRA